MAYYKGGARPLERSPQFNLKQQTKMTVSTPNMDSYNNGEILVGIINNNPVSHTGNYLTDVVESFMDLNGPLNGEQLCHTSNFLNSGNFSGEKLSTTDSDNYMTSCLIGFLDNFGPLPEGHSVNHTMDYIGHRWID